MLAGPTKRDRRSQALDVVMELPVPSGGPATSQTIAEPVDQATQYVIREGTARGESPELPGRGQGTQGRWATRHLSPFRSRRCAICSLFST